MLKTIHILLDEIPNPPHRILRKNLIEKPKLEWLLYPFSGKKMNRSKLEKIKSYTDIFKGVYMINSNSHLQFNNHNFYFGGFFPIQYQKLV
jgi:hypothetical protein